MCRLTLVKRTYAGPAFVRVRRCSVVVVDDLSVWIRDEVRQQAVEPMFVSSHKRAERVAFLVASRRFRRLVDAQHVSRG